jgi:hypothetical protein
MTDLSDSERAAYAAVDQALRAQPLRPAPRGLAPGVMARLRRLRPRPSFRLAWLDLALSALAGGMALLLLLAWRLVTPQALAHAQNELWLIAVLADPAQVGVWAVTLAGVAGLGAGLLVGLAVLFSRRA